MLELVSGSEDYAHDIMTGDQGMNEQRVGLCFLRTVSPVFNLLVQHLVAPRFNIVVIWRLSVVQPFSPPGLIRLAVPLAGS
jgi:hypothetical protein